MQANQEGTIDISLEEVRTLAVNGWEEFWHDHSRSRDAEVASVADNCRFEERVSRERWAVGIPGATVALRLPRSSTK